MRTIIRKGNHLFLVSILSVISVAIVVAFNAASAQAQEFPEGLISCWTFDEGSGNIADL